MVGEPRFHRGNRQSHDQSTRTNRLQRNDRHPRIAARSGLQCRSLLPQISGTACPAEVHDRAIAAGEWRSGGREEWFRTALQSSTTPSLQICSLITTVIHRATGSSATLGRFCSRGSIRRGPKGSSISLLLITIAITAVSISTNSIVYAKEIPT